MYNVYSDETRTGRHVLTYKCEMIRKDSNYDDDNIIIAE